MTEYYRPKIKVGSRLESLVKEYKRTGIAPKELVEPQEPVINASGSTLTIPDIGTARTLKQVAKLFDINLKEWIPNKQIANLWGNPDKPNRQIKITFTHRDFITNGETASEIKDQFLEDINNHKLKYTPVKYASNTKDQHVLEIAIYDLHYGRLTWDEETGKNYDIKIAQAMFNDCINYFIHAASLYNVSKIIFPIGNDFFNVDNSNNTTKAGTPQSEDSRPMKTFTTARRMVVEAVDKLRQIAPVEIVIVPGNHDMDRIFYLGDTLESWYKEDICVTVDNAPKPHKFKQFGKCMIGLTHNVAKRMNLPAMMAQREPEMWAKSEYREWHTGHCHHDSVREEQNVRIRIIPSLAPPCGWTDLKGYSSTQEAQMFVWSLEKGMISKHNYHP
jgi:hypothetical protein